MIVLVFIGVFALVYYINFRRSRKRLYELAARIPGPFDYPLIGSILIALGKDPLELVTHLMELMHHLPSPMRAWLGPFLLVVIDEPAMVQDILSSPDCVQKPFMYDFFRLSKGLFGAPADTWRRHRKLLNTSFSPAVLKRFVPILNEKAYKFTHELDGHVSAECFDVHKLLARYTLVTIASTTMGIDLSGEKREMLEEYSSNAIDLFTACFERICKPWLHPELIFKLTSTFRVEQHRMAIFKKMSKKIISMRQHVLGQGDSLERQDSETEDKQEFPTAKIFIERLEEISRDPSLDIDADGFQQHIDTLLFGGNDTSAQTLANTLLTLGMYPELQEKVYREIVEVCPGPGPIGYADLSRFSYMEMFIKETLRLLPITGLIARAPTKEVRAGNIIIPNGAYVMMPLLKMHRDKKLWGPEAEEFNPDNFLPERCAERHPYAFIPFSQGPRNCIGMKYGWLSMKILLCHVVRRYRISTDIKLSDIKLSLSLVMKLNKKHLIRLERR